MKKLLFTLLASVMLTGIASAADCSTVLTSNVLLGGFTCTAGGLTFSDFSAVNTTATTTPQVNLAGVNVTNGTTFLTFNPNLLGSQNAASDIYFFFTVTGGVSQVDLSVGGSTGTAAITERDCSTPIDRVNANICTGGPANELASLTNVSGASPVFSAVFANTSPIYTFEDIGTRGELTTFTKSFHTSAVPEPASMLLLGSGLAGIGGVIRKRRKARS